MLAILVVHDGMEWLGEVLDSLDTQTYEHLELLAVDSGSADGSRELLLERLGHERVLVAERDLGFPASVSMALDSAAAARSDAEWILFVHDDLIADPELVARLVAHGVDDPRVGIVGPKLVRHDDPRLLQQVGMAIDLTGRAESGLEPDELDQGQRDRDRPVLYVSTAGMLVRRDVLEGLGRLDRRYHVFRDDLDLCWRAWLTGYDVEVAPEAVARHARAVSNYRRLGQTELLGPRYFAERNTLATLLKCYGAVRLAVVLPLFLLVGVAKVLGFIATRRLNDAWQTLRAWGWNLVHLGETLRLRRPIQERRVRTDAELSPLFARIAPRLRAYGEAIADRLAGGGIDVPAPVREDLDEEGGGRLLRSMSRHPVFVMAVALTVLGLVVVVPFLRAGAIRGGELAPWPTSPMAFLRAYASGWHDIGGVATSAPPSPAQALLGLFGILTFGNEWLAPRLLLFGTLPVAWLLALRAGTLLAGTRIPRVVAATAYALSPPAVAALITGRLGGLVAVATLPALALVGVRLADVHRPPANAWRATAGAAILGAVLVAFEPTAAPLILLAVAIGLIAIAGVQAPAEARRLASIRILLAAAGVFVLLLPWGAELVRPGSPVVGGFGDPEAATSSFLRWLLLVPELDGFPGVAVGAAFPAAGLLGLLLGYRDRPMLVGTLWSIVLVAVFGAWGLGRAGPNAIAWPGVLLLVAALAYSGLLAAAFTTAGEYLRAHAFGWRQIAAVVAASVVGLGGIGATLHLISQSWDSYTVGEPALPAFLSAEQDVPGPYRILVVSDDGNRIRWDLTGPDGPTMVSFGMSDDTDLADLVDDAMTDLVGGVSPAVGAELGLANVLYLYVPEGGRTERLQTMLADQFDLEPQPVAVGLVYRVARWVPRAAYVAPSAAIAIDRRGELPPDAEPLTLEHTDEDTYGGRVPGAGTILLAEPSDPGWEASADGRELDRRTVQGLTRFSVPGDAGGVEVTYGRQTRRTVIVALQAFAGLLAVSLVLRPPSFAESPETRRRMAP